MSQITITTMEPGTYGVQVTEGETTTSHRVSVPEDLAVDLGAMDVDDETLVRESFDFLLEREPAAAILSEFSLSDIAGYYPEYRDELRARLETVS